MEETLSMIHDIEELLIHTPDDNDLIKMLDDLRFNLQQQSSSQKPTSSQYTAGDLCSIPFPCPWSNATILLPARVLPSNDDPAQIHVLVLTPLTQETVPCPSLLSASGCHNPHCIYSHGYSLDVDWLLPIEAMDIYNKERHYHPNAKVLYKSDDMIGTTLSTSTDGQQQQQQVWKMATLLSSDTDSMGQHQWHISTDKSHTCTVGENQVIPLVYLDEDPTSVDNDAAIGDDNNDSVNEDLTEDMGRIDDNKIVGDTNKSFGAWQSHTSGFGEKMMKKMGYIHGEGLGIARQGRSEPVEAYDKGTFYSQSKRPGLGSLEKKKKVKANTKTTCITKDRAGTSSMFDMMNTILDHDHDDHPPEYQPQQKQRKQGRLNGKSDNRSDSSPSTSTTATTQQSQRKLWQLQDKMDRMNKAWQQGMAAVKRNKGTPMEREFQANVDSIARQLNSVKQEMTLVQGSLTRTKNYVKMTTF